LKILRGFFKVLPKYINTDFNMSGIRINICHHAPLKQFRAFRLPRVPF
jgi:hypothetical protein